MMRAIGFLAGVCLTVATFLLLVHTGKHPPAQPVAAAPSAPTPEDLSRMAAAIAEQVDIGPATNASAEAVPAPQTAGTADVETPRSDDAFAPEPAQQLDVQAAAPADTADRQAGSEAGSFLFWSPFRSAWAAEGFARRLTSATQVPVEVVDAGPGKYRVAFSYRDDTERLSRINRIETITGLELE